MIHLPTRQSQRWLRFLAAQTHPESPSNGVTNHPIATVERRREALVGARIAGAGIHAAGEEGAEGQVNGGGSKVTAAKTGPLHFRLCPRHAGYLGSRI